MQGIAVPALHALLEPKGSILFRMLPLFIATLEIKPESCLQLPHCIRTRRLHEVR